MSVRPASSFNSGREEALIEGLADELYAADSAYRLRHRHRLKPERRPEQSRLGVNWLEQHRSYRRIWTPISGMRNDVVVLAGYLRADVEDAAAVADRLCSISWFYARFLVELERFVEREGGLWLLADAESEIAAADAIYSIVVHAPLGEADDSWLRTLLLETPRQELDGFGNKLIAAGDRRRELMGAWVAWIAACPVALGTEHPGCLLHAWLVACKRYIRLIDDDWYRVADWYRCSPRGTEP